MPIPVQCQNCGKSMKVKDDMAGKRGKCPQCGSVIEVPMAGPPPQAAPQQMPPQAAPPQMPPQGGAVGTPVVALFGPPEPATCRPYTDPDRCIVVRTKVDCAPCYPGRLTCETGECMERITLEDVLAAVEGFI